MKYERPERSVVSNGYVYETLGVKYNPVKKRSEPHRELIGKMKDGEFVPNDNFFRRNKMEANKRSDLIKIGAYIVLRYIAFKRFELYRLLKEIFKDEASKILDIAFYMIIKGTDVMQHFEAYAYEHPLDTDHLFSDDDISDLLSGLKFKDIDLFIRSWAAIYKGKSIYITYDSTNMQCFSKGVDIAEKGHDKKGDRDSDIVNVSLALDTKSDMPLFYEVYPGSIVDISECRMMVDRAKYYGIDDIGFILDRGYFSIDNIRYFLRNDYDFLLMCKVNASFLRSVISENIIRLTNDLDNYDHELELYMMTVKEKLFLDKYQYVHLYYNGYTAEKEKRSIMRALKSLEDRLDKIIEKKITNKDDLSSYEKHFRLSYDIYGNLMGYKRRDDEIKRSFEKAGLFIIVTSKKMSAKEALDIYSKRDAIEKVFRVAKDQIGLDVLRVHSTASFESKIFISFIALILRNALHDMSYDLYKGNRKEYTVNAIINELEKIALTLYSDGHYRHRYLLSAKQKRIISIYNLDEKTFDRYIDEIIKDLDDIQVKK